MRKSLVAALAAAPLLLTSPAAAAPPEPIPPQEPMEVEACGTTLLVEELMAKGRVHVKEGKPDKITGPLKVRVTNLETGASVDVNASGPARLSFQENDDGTLDVTFSGRGRQLVWAETDEEAELFAALGLPAVFVSTGPIEATFTYDPEGEWLGTEMTRVPPRVALDVCDAVT